VGRRKKGVVRPPPRLRNEGSILLCEGNVCALWHKACDSTKEAPKFLELRTSEVGLPHRPAPEGMIYDGPPHRTGALRNFRECGL
jgi:hypothetical protein